MESFISRAHGWESSIIINRRYRVLAAASAAMGGAVEALQWCCDGAMVAKMVRSVCDSCGIPSRPPPHARAPDDTDDLTQI